MKKIYMFLSAIAVAFSANAQKISADDVVIPTEGTKVGVLSVNLPLTEEFSAFQFEIEVPEGIKINQVKSGRNMIDDIKLDPVRFEGLDHSVFSKLSSDGKLIKIGCASNSSSTFFNDDESGNPVAHLFDLGLTFDNMEEGDYTLKFVSKNCQVIRSNGSIVELDGIEVKLTVGGPTGINGLEAENGAEVVAYDMAGRRVNAAAKGVKVINGKKVIK